MKTHDDIMSAIIRVAAYLIASMPAWYAVYVDASIMIILWLSLLGGLVAGSVIPFILPRSGK